MILGRNSIGIELEKKYFNLIKEKLISTQKKIFDYISEKELEDQNIMKNIIEFKKC